jgi:pyruvate kinase
VLVYSNSPALQGPKLRVGNFVDTKVHLKDGQLFSFDLKNVAGNNERVRLPHPEILYTLRVGDTLLLDDGKLRMIVVNTTMGENPFPAGGDLSPASLEDRGGSVTCEVIVGGMLSNKKGVNTPSVVLPISPLTEKDRR